MNTKAETKAVMALGVPPAIAKYYKVSRISSVSVTETEVRITLASHGRVALWQWFLEDDINNPRGIAQWLCVGLED